MHLSRENMRKWQVNLQKVPRGSQSWPKEIRGSWNPWRKCEEKQPVEKCQDRGGHWPIVAAFHTGKVTTEETSDVNDCQQFIQKIKDILRYFKTILTWLDFMEFKIQHRKDLKSCFRWFTFFEALCAPMDLRLNGRSSKVWQRICHAVVLALGPLGPLDYYVKHSARIVQKHVYPFSAVLLKKV